MSSVISFENYVLGDLHTAGASAEASSGCWIRPIRTSKAVFEGIRQAREALQFTGFGEAVRLIASEIYQLLRTCIVLSTGSRNA